MEADIYNLTELAIDKEDLLELVKREESKNLVEQFPGQPFHSASKLDNPKN